MAVAISEQKTARKEVLKLKKSEKRIISSLINDAMQKSLSKEKIQLVLENFPLAVYMAKKYVRKDVDIQDLVQVAAIGLIKAVKKYNPGRKGKLSYYAVPTIDGELKHFIRDNCFGIRVSRKCVEINSRIQKYREEFIYKNGREATRTEIAKKFRLKKNMLDRITQTVNAHYLASLDAPVSASGRECFARLEDMIGSDCFSESMLEKEGLTEAIKLLNPRDQLIIKYHFLREFSQEAIATRFKITQAQVSRIIKHACHKIALAMM